MDPREAATHLTKFLVNSVEQARASEAPFYHLEFDRVFPDDVYAAMIRDMPVAGHYRAATTSTSSTMVPPPASRSTCFPNTSAACRRKSASCGTRSAVRCARAK